MLRFSSHDPHGGYKAMNVIVEPDQQTSSGALWLGDYTAAQDRRTLKAQGIKTVLTVAQGLNIYYPQDSEISHKTYNIFDIESADIAKIWNDTYTRIDEGLKKGGVLVHCAAGISRSASTVIAYLMRKKKWGFYETLNFVRARRNVICPNSGFQRQLRQLDNNLKQINTASQQQQQQQQISQPQQSQALQITPQYLQQTSQLNKDQKPSLSASKVTKEQQKLTFFSQLQQEWLPETPTKVTNPMQNLLTPEKIKDSSLSKQQYNQSSLFSYGIQNKGQMKKSVIKTNGFEKPQKQIDKQLPQQQPNLALNVQQYGLQKKSNNIIYIKKVIPQRTLK